MQLQMIVLYFTAFLFTIGILVFALHLNRKYRQDFVTNYFYHLLISAPLAMLGKPLPVLVAQMMQLNQIQTDQLMLSFTVFLAKPLWILSIFFLIKCITSLAGLKLSRIFVWAYFIFWSGYLCAQLFFAIPFFRVGHLPPGVQTLSLIDNCLEVSAIPLIFGLGILWAGRINDRIRRKGTRIFSIIGFVSKAFFWFFIFFSFSFVIPFLFGVILPLPALIYLSGLLKRSSKYEKEILELERCKADLSTRFKITPRENEIIGCICSGLSNKEIANTLFISLNTVKRHANQIYQKLGVKSRVQLVNFIRELIGNKDG
jgi:DNA-binding CsgD family transcriptional regulator